MYSTCPMLNRGRGLADPFRVRIRSPGAQYMISSQGLAASRFGLRSDPWSTRRLLSRQTGSAAPSVADRPIDPCNPPASARRGRGISGAQDGVGRILRPTFQAVFRAIPDGLRLARLHSAGRSQRSHHRSAQSLGSGLIRLGRRLLFCEVHPCIYLSQSFQSILTNNPFHFFPTFCSFLDSWCEFRSHDLPVNLVCVSLLPQL